MTFDLVSWLPVVCTAILMYFARTSHIAVLNYNLFLISLLVWVAAVMAFYRILSLKERARGKASGFKPW
jgi:hypothetical protein